MPSSKKTRRSGGDPPGGRSGARGQAAAGGGEDPGAGREERAKVGEEAHSRPLGPRGASGSHRRDWWILGLILLLGAAFRLSYLRELEREPIFSAPIADAAFHDYWARALVTGDWTPPEGEPDPRIREVPFLRPPGYPYFLAFLYLLTGSSVDGARIAQMLLGLLSCVLAYFLGRSLFRSSIGLILAAFCAFYWAFPYYEGQLHAPALTIVLSFAFLLLLRRWSGGGSLVLLALAGVIIGWIALVRAETLLFVPVAAGWVYWMGRREAAGAERARSPRPLMSAIVLLAGSILAVAPATVRNLVAAHELVLVSANGPINLYIGNNETADGVTTRIPELPEMTGSAGWSCFSYDSIVSALSQETGRKLNYTQASAVFARKAREYIFSHPGRFLALTLKRAALFWGPEEVANNEAISFEKKNSRTLRFNPGFPVVLALSLGGLALLLRDRRGRRPGRGGKAENEGPGPFLVLVGLYILTCFAALLPFIAASRFRAPLIPFIFLFGAYGIWRFSRMIRLRQWQAAGISVVVAAALVFLCSLSLAGVRTDPAWWHTDRALALARHGRPEEAVEELKAALAANPGFVDAHVKLAAILADQGRAAEAVPHLQDVLRHRPDRLDVRLQLGTLLLRQGRTADALRELREVARRQPELDEAQFALGRALLESGENDAAAAAFTRVLALSPDEPAALVNRGTALVRGGDPAKAVPDFQRALQLKPDLAEAYFGLGEAQSALGDQEKAARSYQEAIRLDPHAVEPLINTGNTWANRREWDQAITWYRRALQADPNNVTALYNLAGSLASKGQTAEAIRQVERLLQIDPRHPQALRILSTLRPAPPR